MRIRPLGPELKFEIGYKSKEGWIKTHCRGFSDLKYVNF